MRASALLAGAGGAAAWLLFVGLLATSARGYVWLTLAAAALAWAYASVLMRFGDRGVATGIALSTSIGVGIAVIVVVVRWVSVGWPLW